jgi:Flp pilus assembly protein TadD
MIFRLEMSPASLAIRQALRKLWRPRARTHQLISVHRLSCLLIYLFLAGTVLPVYAQNDLALQASDLMRAGKFHDAELLWRQLEQRYPRNPMILSNLGVALAQQGKLEQAAIEYRKSLALKADQPDVTFDLGIAEFKQGHFSAAIPAFELFAKEKPDDPRSTLLLGMILPILSYTISLPRVVYGVTSTTVP